MALSSTSSENNSDGSPLSNFQHATYVAPAIVVYFLWGPMGVLQGIYAKYYGLALTTIATVVFVSRMFDAITDPLIGYLSDRYREIYGTRKPFVAIGGLIFIVSSYFLYVPFDPNKIDASTTVSTAYFLSWFLLFYLGWTLLEIPHLAWATELAQDSKGKNKLYILRAMAASVGILFFYLVPLLPVFETQEFNPHTLQWSVTVAGLIMLLSLYLCITRTPRGVSACYKSPQKESFRSLRRQIFSNKPFLIFIAAFSLYSIGSGMWFTLIFIFVDGYLKLGNQFALVTAIALIINIAMLSFWYWLANVKGKRFTLIMIVSLATIGVMAMGFITPGPQSAYNLYPVIILVYMGGGVGALAPSVLSEIIDYSSWKFGLDRSATYFSIYAFALKTSQAVGGVLGLGIAGWYGFSPAMEQHAVEAVTGLQLSASKLPALLMLLSIFLFGLLTINDYRYQIISRRLQQTIPRVST